MGERYTAVYHVITHLLLLGICTHVCMFSSSQRILHTDRNRNPLFQRKIQLYPHCLFPLARHHRLGGQCEGNGWSRLSGICRLPRSSIHPPQVNRIAFSHSVQPSSSAGRRGVRMSGLGLPKRGINISLAIRCKNGYIYYPKLNLKTSNCHLLQTVQVGTRITYIVSSQQEQWQR